MTRTLESLGRDYYLRFDYEELNADEFTQVKENLVKGFDSINVYEIFFYLKQGNDGDWGLRIGPNPQYPKLINNVIKIIEND